MHGFNSVLKKLKPDIMNIGQNTFWKYFVSWVIPGWLTLFSHFGTYDSIKHCEKKYKL